jgi:hypothetical protein
MTVSSTLITTSPGERARSMSSHHVSGTAAGTHLSFSDAVLGCPECAASLKRKRTQRRSESSLAAKFASSVYSGQLKRRQSRRSLLMLTAMLFATVISPAFVRAGGWCHAFAGKCRHYLSAT